MLSLSRTCTLFLQRPAQRTGRHPHSVTRRCATGGSRGTLVSRSPVQCKAVSPSSKDLATELDDVAAQARRTTDSSPDSKPMLSMRPITTHVNVMVTGSQHIGRVPYFKMADVHKPASDKAAAAVQSQAAQKTKAQASDPTSKSSDASPHAAFSKDPSAWATTLKAVLLPEACREMVYTIQDTPGQSSALDPFIHMESLLAFVLRQQAKDYKQLAGCRGLHKSLACGCLEHSPTVCIYTLPVEGPSKTDLMVMSVLSQHVALLPVITGPSSSSGESCTELVSHMLNNPATYVEGLAPIELIKFAETSGSASQLPLLLVDQSPKKVSQALVKLISSDQVYLLLDNAWEKYNTFCEVYEQAGRDVDALLKGDINKLCMDVVKSTSSYRKYMEGCNTIEKLQIDKRLLALRGDLLKMCWDCGYGRSYLNNVDSLLSISQTRQLAEVHGFKLPEDTELIRKNWSNFSAV